MIRAVCIACGGRCRLVGVSAVYGGFRLLLGRHAVHKLLSRVYLRVCVRCCRAFVLGIVELSYAWLM